MTLFVHRIGKKRKTDERTRHSLTFAIPDFDVFVLLAERFLRDHVFVRMKDAVVRLLGSGRHGR